MRLFVSPHPAVGVACARERPLGLTRTGVFDIFSRNKKRREIECALAVLDDTGVCGERFTACSGSCSR